MKACGLPFCPADAAPEVRQYPGIFLLFQEEGVV